MATELPHLRVILIGGSSHVGKSTVAQALATQLGWSYQSTDKLAKHPGRPWRTSPKVVPDHVSAHYLTLSVDELIADVMRHYRDNVWPLVETLVARHATGGSNERLVLEGSALLPELVATMKFENIAAIWLTGSRELFQQRIYQSSAYETRSPDEQKMIDRFMERTWRYNESMVEAVGRLGLASVQVDNAGNADEVLSACLIELGKQEISKRLAGQFGRARPQRSARKQVVRLERDAVCAWDDMLGPIVGRVSVEKTASLADALKLVKDSDFLPRIVDGKATWVAMASIPLAVVAQEWAEPRFLVDPATPLADLVGKEGKLFFRYFEQNNPEAVFQAQRGGSSGSTHISS